MSAGIRSFLNSGLASRVYSNVKAAISQVDKEQNNVEKYIVSLALLYK